MNRSNLSFIAINRFNHLLGDKKVVRLLFLFLLLTPLFPCTGQESASYGKYTYEKGDLNGIGKWYMGREIAHVMGFQGIDWLERTEREAEENTAKLLGNMDIQAGETIADIGAGSGYHVFKMAPLAGEGLIYAVDIQDEMLAALRNKMQNGKHKNIALIRGSEKNVNLPENSIDKVLMVDVYHEFAYPFEMIASIKRPFGQMENFSLSNTVGKMIAFQLKDFIK